MPSYSVSPICNIRMILLYLPLLLLNPFPEINCCIKASQKKEQMRAVPCCRARRGHRIRAKKAWRTRYGLTPYRAALVENACNFSKYKPTCRASGPAHPSRKRHGGKTF